MGLPELEARYSGSHQRPSLVGSSDTEPTRQGEGFEERILTTQKTSGWPGGRWQVEQAG